MGKTESACVTFYIPFIFIDVTDEATQKLHECISKVKVLPEVRNSYMTLEEKIFYERLEGKIESLIEVLEEYDSVPVDILEKLYAETDLERIKKWTKLAAKVKSMEEFIENM